MHGDLYSIKKELPPIKMWRLIFIAFFLMFWFIGFTKPGQNQHFVELTACPQTAVFGQNAGEALRSKPVTPEDFSTLKGVSELNFAPDGRRLTFEQGGAIWILKAQPGSTPQKLAEGFTHTWSPKGSEIAFYQNVKESGELQIFTYNLRTQRIEQRTNVPGGVAADKIGWSSKDVLVFSVQVPLKTVLKSDSTSRPESASAEQGTPLVLRQDSPDGYALAGILTAVSGPRKKTIKSVSELFVHDLATQKTRQLTHDEVGYYNPTWSPEGKMIVCISREGRSLGHSELALYLIDSTTGNRTLLVPGLGTRKLSPSWSPDGGSIAYIFHSFTDPAKHGVAVIEIDGGRDIGKPQIVQSGAVLDLAWSPDNRSLLLIHTEVVTQSVIRVRISTGETRTVGSANYVAFDETLTVSRNGAVAWAEGRGDTPCVIRLLRAGEKESVEIYDPNPQVRTWALGEQEIVRWKNRHGHDRVGILIKPAGYQPGVRYPLIVSAYSETSHPNGFQRTLHPGFANQAHASGGCAVFFPGPRLPWMYGSLLKSEAEARAIRGADGWEVTVDDIESGVDVLIERGIADPDRLVVMGFSNGGAAATALITRTNRYQAAVIVAPANLNWVEQALFEDNLSGRWLGTKTSMGVSEEIWENPLAYVKGSPVFLMHKVETPVLLAVGDLDDPSITLPTIEMYLALRQQEKEVTLLRYPNLGHWFYGPAHDDLNERIRVFLDERLTRQD